MIINDWDTTFTAKYGHNFPDAYLCIDTEYTGNDSRRDLIVEIGHTMVEKGQVVDARNLVLNWYGFPEVREDWLDYKLNMLKSIVGPGWRLTPAVVKAEGVDPLKALKFYDKLFSVWQARNLPFVAQNGQNADERIITGNFDRFLNKPFSLPDNAYFDTGAIYKANKVWQTLTGDVTNFRSIMVPSRSDTLKSYFGRVINARIPGVKWSLSLIVEEYGLMQKHAIDSKDFHSAGFDSLCLHWIMEEFRKQIKPKQLPSVSASVAFQEMYDDEMAKYERQASQAKVSQADTHPPATQPESSRSPLPSSNQPKRRQRLI
jgi:hypothetical protein